MALLVDFRSEFVTADLPGSSSPCEALVSPSMNVAGRSGWGLAWRRCWCSPATVALPAGALQSAVATRPPATVT